jgi:hypothetical protein
MRPNPDERLHVSVLLSGPTVSPGCGGDIGVPRWEKSHRDVGFANGKK